jgi:hypothetical protein
VRKDTLGEPADLAVKTNGDNSMLVQRSTTEGVYVVALRGPRDLVKAIRPAPQPPAMPMPHPLNTTSIKAVGIGWGVQHPPNLPDGGQWAVSPRQEADQAPPSRSYVRLPENVGSPTGCEPSGDGASIAVSGRESRLPGGGRQVFATLQGREGRAMRNAETVLGGSRDRGRRGLPLTGSSRPLANPQLFLHASATLAKNRGAMPPGVTAETVEGMGLANIQAITARLRYARYRGTPGRRIAIAKQRARKRRPLGLPTWADTRLQEVSRSLLGAYGAPQLSAHGHGFRPGRGCPTALTEMRRAWKGIVWLIEGDLAPCFDRLDHGVLMAILRERIQDHRFVRVIAHLLKAGDLEPWVDHAALSGAPHGGGVSPLLSTLD